MSMNQDKNQTIFFKSTEKSGFIPSQVIYVEGEYNEKINLYFIKKNYEQITVAFKKAGFDFIFLPKVVDDINHEPPEKLWKAIKYFYPSLSRKSIFNQENKSKITLYCEYDHIPNNSFLRQPSFFYDYAFHITSGYFDSSDKCYDIDFPSRTIYDNIHLLFSALGYEDEIRPGLFRLVNDSDTDDFTFEYFVFDLSEESNLWLQIEGYLKRFASKKKYHSSIDNDLPAATTSEEIHSTPVKRVIRRLFEKCQRILEKYFKKDPDAVRRAAVEKITYNKYMAYMAYMAKNSEDNGVRLKAAGLLTDKTLAQKVYIDIAKNEEDSSVCEAAIAMITDLNTLIDIAKNAQDRYVCTAAMERLRAINHSIYYNLLLENDIELHVFPLIGGGGGGGGGGKYFNSFGGAFQSFHCYNSPRMKPLKPSKPSYYIPKKLINFMAKVNEIINEANELGIYDFIIRERIETFLKSNGYDIDAEKKISRLEIDKKYNIYLTDYIDENDKKTEIKMPALSKAVYILFLRYREGIVLYNLSDYKQELMDIYQNIFPRSDYEATIRSIENLCTPGENSIYEKLSMIKKAFVKKIPEKLAEFYYIAGIRGEEMKIKIDRALIKIPGILKVKCAECMELIHENDSWQIVQDKKNKKVKVHNQCTQVFINKQKLPATG